ncbi:hypothetical protein TNCT_497161 [Trichonephila clavata]|uniref:Transmembrane protein n=1 Tax=Trichonephila clavata TaxID=2740835 RepID=A0A8X6GIE7_TRICU|nr:hypothetical protein TNCT_497161 [Trichonephila clavata]
MENEIDQLVDYMIGRFKNSKLLSLCGSLVLFSIFVGCCGALVYVLSLSRYTASLIGLGLVGIASLALSFMLCRWFCSQYLDDYPKLPCDRKPWW